MKHLKYFLIVFSSVVMLSCASNDDADNIEMEQEEQEEEDVEEEASNIIQLTIEIEEIPVRDTFLATVEAPAGEGEVVYVLVNESDTGAFQIDDLGSITVMKAHLFNFESREFLTAKFSANRGDDFNILELTVNIIDYLEEDKLFLGAEYYNQVPVSLQYYPNGKPHRYYDGTFDAVFTRVVEYDDSGRVDLIRAFDDGGYFCLYTNTFTYDDEDRIATVTSVYTDYDYCEQVDKINTVEYLNDGFNIYDDEGNLIREVEFDNQGRVEYVMTNDISYNYMYEDGNLTAIVSSDNSLNREFHYDNFKNPHDIELFEPVYNAFLYSDFVIGITLKSWIDTNNRVEISQEENSSYWVYDKDDYPIQYYPNGYDDGGGFAFFYE